MPNNYTVTTVSSTLASGSGITGNVILTVIPNSGIAISASDFNISGGTPSSGTTFTDGVGGVTLPTQIDSVTFLDSGTPGIIGNIVYVTAIYGAGHVMPAGDLSVLIDIDTSESTRETSYTFGWDDWVTISQSYPGVAMSNSSVVTSPYVLSPDGATSQTGLPPTSEIKSFTGSTTTAGVEVTAYTKTFVADAGFYFLAAPAVTTYGVSGSQPSQWNITTSNTVYDANGNLTEVSFLIKYTPIASDTYGVLDWHYEMKQTLFTTEPEILGCRYAASKYETIKKASNYNGTTGENIQFFLKGSGGANAAVRIIRVSDGSTYDFNTNVFTTPSTYWNATFPTPTGGASYTELSVNVSFPPVTSVDSFVTMVHAISPTSLVGHNEKEMKCWTHIPQGGEIDTTFSVTGTAPVRIDGYTPHVTTPLRGDTLAGATLPIERAAEDPNHFELSIPVKGEATHALDGTFSNTDKYVLGSLTNVAVGSFVTHGNISSTTYPYLKVTEIDPDGDNPLEIRVSQVVAEQLDDGSSMSFSVLLGVTRDPQISDFTNNTNIEATIRTVSDSVTFTMDDTTGISVGLFVEGPLRTGAPSVVSVVNNTVVISTPQSFSSGDSLTFSDNYSQFSLYELTTTAGGKNAITVTAKGYIEYVGIRNATPVLNLDGFIEVLIPSVVINQTYTVHYGEEATLSLLDGSVSGVEMYLNEVTAPDGNGNPEDVGETAYSEIPFDGGTTVRYKAPAYTDVHVTNNNGYVPGTDTFTFKAIDGFGNSNVGTVTINLVMPTNFTKPVVDSKGVVRTIPRERPLPPIS